MTNRPELNEGAAGVDRPNTDTSKSVRLHRDIGHEHVTLQKGVSITGAL